MAKKQQSGKKFLGSKISRGTNNEALTPSGGSNQETSFESVIRSSTDAIISHLKSNEETNKSILTALDKLPSLDVHETIENFKDSIEDKMIAMIGAMYGFRGATTNMKSQQFLNMLSKIDPRVTANRGIYMTLKAIEDLLIDMQKPSYDKQMESIAEAVNKQISDIKSSILDADNAAKNVGVSLNIPEDLIKRLDTLKDSVIANNSANNILRVSGEINELKEVISNIKVNDYTSHINNIVKNIKNLNDKVGDIVAPGNPDLTGITNEFSKALSIVAYFISVVPEAHLNTFTVLLIRS